MVVSIIDKLAIARLGPHRFLSSGLSYHARCCACQVRKSKILEAYNVEAGTAKGSASLTAAPPPHG